MTRGCRFSVTSTLYPPAYLFVNTRLYVTFKAMTDSEITELVREALDQACSRVKDVASAAGISPHTIWSWSSGRRRPSADSVLRLADELERRGDELSGIAKKLRKAAR